MKSVRNGARHQAIDHLICCSLIEGRSCEKFQFLAQALGDVDPELASFYGGLVESEGNHYASYLIMAKGIDEHETSTRLDYYLDLDAQLIQQPNPLPMLH
jgi:tRNA-(ms[2]io[6]A)-hydroxylase